MPAGLCLSIDVAARAERYLELWWQYGAEDLMVAETAGPTPRWLNSESIWCRVGHQQLVLAVEGAVFSRLLAGMRPSGARTEGFTREGLGMGHWVGGDAMTAWLSLTWLTSNIGVELWGDRSLESAWSNGSMSDWDIDDGRRTIVIGFRGWKARSDGGWWRIGAG